MARRRSFSCAGLGPGSARNLIRLWVHNQAGEFTDELAEAVRIAELDRKVGSSAGESTGLSP